MKHNDMQTVVFRTGELSEEVKVRLSEHVNLQENPGLPPGVVYVLAPLDELMIDVLTDFRFLL